jgi:hypothetical protein
MSSTTSTLYVPAVEAAHRIGVNYGRLYSMMLGHEVDARQVGKRWEVAESDVRRLEAARATQSTPKEAGR